MSSITESRFNEVAKAMHLSVEWRDQNRNGIREENELSAAKKVSAKAEAGKVDARMSELDANAKKFLASGIPNISSAKKSLVVGNKVIFDEVLRILKAHGDDPSSIETLTPVDSVKAPLETVVISGININNDKHPDFLILQSLETYVAPYEAGTHGTTSFLAAVLGSEESDKSGTFTADMLKGAALLNTASYPGTSYPINNFDIRDENRDGINEIAYRAFDPVTQLYIYYDVDTNPKGIPSDKALFDALFGIDKYYTNSFGYFDVLKGAEFKKGNAAASYAVVAGAAIYNSIPFAFLELQKRYNELSKGGKDYADGIYLPYAKTLIDDAREVLLLSEADKVLEVELQTKSEEVFAAEHDAFKWKGKNMNRSEYYNALSTVVDSTERGEMTRAYAHATINALWKEGGLFSAIDKFNQIAQKYGFKHYPDMALNVYNKSSVKEFVGMMDEVHEKSGEELKKFVAELKELNGGREVHEWDVPYLTNLMIKKETGLKELPTLSAGDAMSIAKKYYRDIGIDLDKPPFVDNMFFDTKKRENKRPNAFAATIGDGSKTWFNTNFDPKEKVSLDDLGTIIHELAHDIHMIAGAKNGGGNVSMNAVAAQTSAFTEGFAITMEDRVYDPVFIEKYLSNIPGFSDPKVRSTISRVKSASRLYEDMKIMVRARQEIELYMSKDENEKDRKIEDRIIEMTKIARKYLHVETEPDKLDFWSLPHPSGSNLYYSNYSLGRTTAALACKEIVDAMNGLRPPKNTAKMILDVFHQGAKLYNLEMIRKYVEGRQGKSTGTSK